MTKEIRTLPAVLEVRDTDPGSKRTITGHIDYNCPSDVLTDYWGDRFIEELAAGCFDGSMAARDVVALWSHDITLVLGSTKNKTLRVASDQEQLSFELDLPDTQAGSDALTLIQRGDVAGLSFGMIVKDDKWTEVEHDGQTVYKRTILEAVLFELSPVAFPAYPTAEVSCRSFERFKEANNMEKSKMESTLERLEAEVEELRGEQTETAIPPVTITRQDPALTQRAAFNHYLRTGEVRNEDQGVGDDPLLMVSGSGGALAPVGFAKEIIDSLNEEVVMRQLARILPPISGKSAAYPRRTGGTGAAMVAEGEAIVPYDLTFDQVVLTPHKAACLVEVSNELLQDTGVDLAGYLAQHFRDEIGELLENQYWLGDATEANLQGILTAEDPTGELVIERVPTEGDDLDVDDIFALWAALPTQYRKNAVFVCNPAFEAELYKMRDAEGRLLVIDNLTDPLKRSLLGRPLITASEFPGTLEAETDVLVAGDFKRAVFIADKKGIDIQRNDGYGFNKDTVAFRATFRTDIALAWPEALRILSIKGAG